MITDEQPALLPYAATARTLIENIHLAAEGSLILARFTLPDGREASLKVVISTLD